MPTVPRATHNVIGLVGGGEGEEERFVFMESYYFTNFVFIPLFWLVTTILLFVIMTKCFKIVIIAVKNITKVYLEFNIFTKHFRKSSV